MTVAVVVLEVIALIFEGIEGFILNLPPSATTSHQFKHIGCGDDQIGNPAKMLHLVAFNFPILDEVNQ